MSTETNFANLKSTISHLNMKDASTITEEIQNYLSYYNLPSSGFKYHIGHVDVNGEKIAVQSFMLENSRGTVYVIHGYFDHVGYMSPVIKQSLDTGYSVVAFDLVGHGLSTGPRAEVNDFKHYVQSLEKVIKETESYVVKPFSVIAHSTGAAVVIDFLLNQKKSLFNQTLLLAPLVRPANWYPIVLLSSLVTPFTKKVKRSVHKESGKEGFHKFRSNDPMQFQYIPLLWIFALRKWVRAVKRSNSVSSSLHIIQGTKDSVIDWKYNCRFLEKKFKGSKIHFLKNADHYLIHQAPYKEDVKDLITNILKKDLIDH